EKNLDRRIWALRFLAGLAAEAGHLPPLVLDIAHSGYCGPECRLSLGDYLGRAEASGAALPDLERLWAAVCPGSRQLACTSSRVARHIGTFASGETKEMPDACVAQLQVEAGSLELVEDRCVASLLESAVEEERAQARQFVFRALEP